MFEKRFREKKIKRMYLDSSADDFFDFVVFAGYIDIDEATSKFRFMWCASLPFERVEVGGEWR